MKKKFIVLFLSLTLLLNGCGNTTTSKKSSELSGKYDFYQESVKNIQKNMDVDPDQADEIFLTLIDCGVSELINYVIKNNDNTFSVWSSGKEYSVTLSGGVVSTVFTNDFLKEVQLYPAPENETTSDANVSSDTQQAENPTEKPTDKSTESPEEKPKPTRKPRKKAIGKSDKDISDTDNNFTVHEMREDVTGNFRKVEIADSSFVPQEYALSYYNNCFESDKEVHYIVNFSTMTTTCITCVLDTLDITTTEYVDREQFSAKDIGGGLVLERYTVYLDNGDIKKLKI